MIVLGIDTATPSTAVALRLADGSARERRDDPGAGGHPGHATRLLAMVDELLRASGTGWKDVGRVAVGVGPGSFTGLRVGVATAHGLAGSRSLELVGVSSLRALALSALAAPAAPELVLAVIDARRGEVFAAAYEPGADGLPRPLAAPAALAPERLPEVLAASAAGPAGAVAFGDGAVRYAELLEAAGLVVAAPDSSLHRVAAAAVCELGARAAPARQSGVLPEYVRRPDAELALEGARGATRAQTAA